MDDIVDYILFNLSSEAAALDTVLALEKAIYGLSNLPYRYSMVNDERLAYMGFRKFPVKSYIVFYSVNEELKIVRIERILHSKQDWTKHI